MKLFIVPRWLTLVLESARLSYASLTTDGASGILSKNDFAFYMMVYNRISDVVPAEVLNSFDISLPTAALTNVSVDEIKRELETLNVKYGSRQLSAKEFLALSDVDGAAADGSTDGLNAVGLEVVYSGPEGLFVTPIPVMKYDYSWYEKLFAEITKSQGVPSLSKLEMFASYCRNVGVNI